MSSSSSRRDSFPTRQYSYRPREEGSNAPATFGEAAGVALQPGVYRFRLGRDIEPQPLSSEDITASLHDPFARLVLLSGKLPSTLRELLAVLEATNSQDDGLPQQGSFVVADGGQIPWTPGTEDVARQFRFLITRGRNGKTPDLFVSTSREIDSPSTFLQVVGWDPVNDAFQFYDRREQTWIWAGSSWDALEADTRGKGPFDSHVNGALTMKELKQPWINWHSMAATIDSALAPDDLLRSEAIWRNRRGAEHLEQEVIKPNIQRWTDSRFEHRTVGGKISRLRELMGQILETTAINLIASPDESSRLQAGEPIHLPLTFFINSDALFNLLDLSPDIAIPAIDGGLYRDCLTKFEVALTDGIHKFPGDTHFAFAVPEVAFEDIAVLKGLLGGVITPKLAAGLLMVDFCNPVFSPRRAALIRYIPETAQVGAPDTFATAFTRAVESGAAGLSADSPEQEFLANWRLAENGWKASFEARIKGFFDALELKLRGLDSFSDIFRIAESRRREFRRRPLAEFRLTTPITNIPEDSPFLEFTPDASIRVKA